MAWATAIVFRSDLRIAVLPVASRPWTTTEDGLGTLGYGVISNYIDSYGELTDGE